MVWKIQDQISCKSSDALPGSDFSVQHHTLKKEEPDLEIKSGEKELKMVSFQRMKDELNDVENQVSCVFYL